MTSFAGIPEETRSELRTVPTIRLRELVEAEPRVDGEFVLYWMIAFRRARSNFALQHARDLASALGRPLLILEPLRVDYPWASERMHRFVVDGMGDNEVAFRKSPATYAAYVEPERGAARGLMQALAERACAVVTDDFPAFFLPRATAALAERIRVPLVAVDGNGLLPLRRARRAHPTARGFRRVIHEQAVEGLLQAPEPEPLARVELPRLSELPAELRQRWPVLARGALEDPAALLSELPIDREVAAVAARGGSRAARRRLGEFLEHDLAGYGDGRNHPDDDGASGLSHYLHFGHLGVHEVLSELEIDPDRFEPSRAGKREGFWRLSTGKEAFLDELLTWRELAYNGAAHLPGYDRYESLPDWARATLKKHASDPRPERYDIDRLAAAETQDALWNAAQRQLVRDGRMHNYLRMLWGKRILEWSARPQDAFDVMVELNNRYALDGRDPNSYAGIAWVLGRYDRPWGPERPIFGTVRFMSSRNTARKLRVKRYLERYAA
ncbi:MAG: deoxyribodipyrimidine photolyase [Myxococcales bacterium]|jgi:deoxyribodipyrimidine photo-lyase